MSLPAPCRRCSSQSELSVYRRLSRCRRRASDQRQTMHVAFIDTTIRVPPTGGAARFLVTLGSELARRRIRVTIVTQPGPDSRLTDELKAAGVAIVDSLWKPYHLGVERARRLSEWVAANQLDLYVISTSPD